MITNIALENFKCFRHIDLNPKLITVLIGPNGTGKSGVLQALMLLKQSKDNNDPLVLDGGLVRIEPGAFALRGVHHELDEVRLSLSGYWGITFEGIDDRAEFESHLTYSGDAKLRNKQGGTRVNISGQVYEVPFSYSTGQRDIRTPRGSINYQERSGINNFRIVSYSGGTRDFLTFWMEVSQAPADALGSMKVVPAARALAHGLYPLGPTLSEEISNAGGLGKQEDDTATTLAYSRREVEKVSNLMKQVTGVGFRADNAPPQSIKPVSESPAGDFSLTAEGFGTNTLVHLLFELVRAVPGATVLIEEPEIHLHPKAQAELASVMVEEAKAASKQIIMTTHSEHVAGRLLTLVAENKLSSDELAIYSFEKDDSGVCSATEIEVTERGQVSGGLKSFFETDLDEMRRYVDALRAKA